MSAPLTPEREQKARIIAARAADDPFFVSDCEGDLSVWRESALTHVRRDESGEIDMYSFPSSYRATDQVIEFDLDSWDPGEDASDDQRRQDIGDMADGRVLVAPLLAEIDRLRAELAARPTRAEVLREGAQIADRFNERYEDFDAMKAAGIIGPHTMAGAISSELRAQAIAAERSES